MSKLNEVYDELKESLKTGYFEELIWEKLVQEYLWYDFCYEAEEGAWMRKMMQQRSKAANYKASLTEKELEQVVSDTKELKKFL